MIRVNLLPEEQRAPEPTQVLSAPSRGFWLPLAIGLAVLLPLAGISVMQQVKISGLRADIQVAEAESRRLAPQIQQIQTLMHDRAEINQRLVTVQALARGRNLPVQILDELADRTPDYMWFTKVDHKATGEVTLEGMTFSNLLVAELMTRLEEGDLFEDISLNVTERKMVGGQPVIRFEVSTWINM